MIAQQGAGMSLAGATAQAVNQRQSDGLGQALRAAEAGNPDAAAEAFGSLLSTMLVQEMRRSLSDGFFGGGAVRDSAPAGAGAAGEPRNGSDHGGA